MNSQCPLPLEDVNARIVLAHGEGGRATRSLIRDRVLPVFGASNDAVPGDSALLPDPAAPLAFTTDSFVVSPLEFPGGDIGSLAVYGTVNDLAVSGAEPLWLSLSLIIEEGLPLERFDRIIASAAKAASEAGVRIVTGDTKVVPVGAADRLFITTAGVGRHVGPMIPGPSSLRVGDELIVTGPVGRHGIAILAAREALGFEPPPASDCAPLTDAVRALRKANIPVRALRDATRGGVTAVLHEFAEACQQTLLIDESLLPVCDIVRGACELLGLEPLHIACEGTMVCAVAAGAGEAAVQALREVEVSRSAARIGFVQEPRGAPVVVRRRLGAERVLDEPSGAPLPRIC